MQFNRYKIEPGAWAKFSFANRSHSLTERREDISKADILPKALISDLCYRATGDDYWAKFLFGQIMRESDGDMSVKSSANAIGMCQITQIALDELWRIYHIKGSGLDRKLTLEDMWTPYWNVLAQWNFIRIFMRKDRTQTDLLNIYLHGESGYNSLQAAYKARVAKGERPRNPYGTYAKDAILNQASYVSPWYLK